MMFKNYEEFTKSFNEENTKKDALLLLEIQDWIIKFINNNWKYDDYYHNLDNFFYSDHTNYKKKKDYLNPIFEKIELPSKKIFLQMKNKIIKENEIIPVYKVRELNSSSINWISKFPGKTIKSKIKSSPSILAPIRKFSYDTGENRLFLEFCKRLKVFLENKLDAENDQFELNGIEYFLILLNKFLSSENVKEIKRWENFPPNNTLLSDQNYKKIWQEWKNINKIDSMIENSYKKIDLILITIFYFELLNLLKKDFDFIQSPINVNYEEYKINIIYNKVEGYSKTLLKKIIVSFKEKESVEINYDHKKLFVTIENQILKFVNNKTKKEIKINKLEDIREFIKKNLTFYKNSKIQIQEKSDYNLEIKKENIVVDFFNLNPIYIDNDMSKTSNLKLLQQFQIFGNKEHSINCENSTVIDIYKDIYTSTLFSEINNFRNKEEKTGSENNDKTNKSLNLLIKILSNKFLTDKLSFVFPDIFNEFDLSKLYKILKLEFKQVESIPKSIAAVFYNEKVLKKYDLTQSCVIVLDLIGNELTLTLVKPNLKDRDLENEIIWERHPTVIRQLNENNFKNIYKEIDRKYANLFNLTRKNTINNGLKIKVEEEKILNLENIENNQNININSEITEFIKSHKEIIKPIIFSLSHNLVCDNYRIINISDEEVLMGYNCYLKKYNSLELSKKNVDLWRDYLPGLGIKLLFGKFDLIGDEGIKIIPRLGKKEIIKIKNTFTIIKNDKNEYRFPLVKNGISKKVDIEAVLRPQVELKENIKCKLELTYTYGSEKPYELIFKPIDYEGITELKVRWEKKENINVNNEFYKFYISELRNKRENFKKIKDKFSSFNEYLSDDYLKIENNPQYVRISKLKEIDNFFYYKIDYFVDNNIKKYIGFSKKETIESKIIIMKKEKNTKNIYLDVNNWRENNYGKYNYNQNENIIFYSDNYLDSDIYNPNLKYTLKNRVDSKNRYVAKNIRSVEYENFGRLYEIDFMFYDSMFYQLRKLFMQYTKKDYSENSKKMYTYVENIRENILKLYYNSQNKEFKDILLKFMSITADIFGEQYIEIFNNTIEKYKFGEDFIDEIGYSITRFSEIKMIKMLDKLKEIDKNKVVNVLSKNLWFSNKLIEKLSTKKILEYFKITKDVLEEYCNTEINDTNKKYLEKNISNALMFILGLLRRRTIDKYNKKLTINNSDFEKVYSIIEKLSEKNLKIESFLNLKNKEYEDISGLLVIVAKYLTGYKMDIEIDINETTNDEVYK